MKRFLRSMVFVAGLAFGGSVVHADVHPGIQGLNDLLIQKGIVTKEEVEAQSKKHSLNITGYIQVQGAIIQNSASSGDEDGFKVRRAKLAASGYAYENVKFKLETNFVGKSGTSATPNTPILDDAYIEDDHLSYLVGRVGQFKVPFSLEELTSDTEILSIERAEVVKKIAPGRDQGISFSGNIPETPASYSVGAFNGRPGGEDAAKNEPNDNNQMMLVGRLTAKPIEWLTVGISALKEDSSTDREAYGIELQGKVPQTGCTLQGEYLSQKLGNTKSDGFYVEASHFFIPQHLEAVLKYEKYNDGTNVSGKDDINWLTIGANFYIHGNDAKVMANYIIKGEENNGYDNDTLLAQVQLRF